MTEENIPGLEIIDKDKADHKVADLYYTLNFELTKISDSKASTLVVIAGQSILITAFLLASTFSLGYKAIYIVIGFGLSVIFNVIAIFLAILALRPRTFQETSSTLQPLYTYITRRTKEEFINEFLKLNNLTREANDRHYAEIIYQISTILQKKMRYVHLAARLFFVGIGLLAISIFILIIEIFI